MNVNASGLNVNHHKKLSSSLPGKNVEEKKKNKLTTNVDKDKDKDKKRLHKGEAYKVELSKQGKKKADAVEMEHFNSLAQRNDELENFDTFTTAKAIEEAGVDEATGAAKEADAAKANPGEKPKTAEEEFMERLHDTINIIRSGRSLSKKQEDWLESELTALAAKRFDLSKNLHLTRDDQSIMEALGNNIKQRRRILNNLLQQVDSTEGKNGFTLIEINNIMEQKEMEDELKVMKASLKDKDEEEDDKEVKDKEKAEREDEFTDEAEEIDDKVKEDTLKDEKRAAEIIDQNIADIDSLKPQQREEQFMADKSDAMIDSSYRYAKETLKSDKATLADKADALEEFNAKAQMYAHKREEYRNKAEYDAETAMLARIMLLQHDDLNEVIKRDKDKYKVPFLDQDTVIELLQR